MRIATGFGINSEEVKQVIAAKTDRSAEADLEGEVTDSNVLDWSNSSMLAFVSLFYVSPFYDHVGFGNIL